MEPTTDRRTEKIGDTLRRLARRGARSHISKILGKIRSGDLAYLMRGMTPAERYTVFEVLIKEYPDAAGDVLTDVDSTQRVDLLEHLTPEGIAGILEHVAVDDAVFLVESLPVDLRSAVVELVDLRKLEEVQTHLTYEDDTAGRIMDPLFFALPASTPVRQAIKSIQSRQEVEMIFYLYVVDAEGRLAGVTSLRQLLLSSPDHTLAEIAQRDMIKVHTSTDQEEVAQLAARYDLLAIPVVDEDDRLAGIVTVDDIVDVFKEEATEDFFKMVGTSDDELLYQDRSLRVAGIRLPWLMVNMAGLVVTGLLLEHFQGGFKEALFLLTFVPVIMGMGGNTGSQTSTITVRGLATGRVSLGEGRAMRFLWQQVKVGAIIGVVTGLVVAGVAMVLEANPYFSLVVGVALFSALLLSSLCGAVIPLLAERFGVDPAVAAGPLVTTISDVTGILIYFSLATVLFNRLIA